jgi:hypothetical protein
VQQRDNELSTGFPLSSCRANCRRFQELRFDPALWQPEWLRYDYGDWIEKGWF